MEYKEEDYLQISGLQHFRFCRRQWALIHIEQQWAENLRTTEGHIIHERAHDSSLREKRGDMLICRDMRVFSPALGISGNCDIVEFIRDENGVNITGTVGKYLPYPVEYKHGSPREDTANHLQLCAQAMCLEEMLCCDIPNGALYYHEIRRREQVDFTEELRNEVKTTLLEMHELYNRRFTPKVNPGKHCNACSLKDICIPKIMNKKPVKTYIAEHLEADL